MFSASIRPTSFDSAFHSFTALNASVFFFILVLLLGLEILICELGIQLFHSLYNRSPSWLESGQPLSYRHRNSRMVDMRS